MSKKEDVRQRIARLGGIEIAAATAASESMATAPHGAVAWPYGAMAFPHVAVAAPHVGIAKPTI